MKKILVFQHVAHEILGTFHPLLKEAGFRIRYANFDRDANAEIEMKRYDGLVILGGPMGVYESHLYPHLTREIDGIREAIASGKPVLGICLGAQLIASALGAPVAPHREKEIGWYEISLTDEGKRDALLGNLAPRETLFQWHGDTFQIPPGAVCLAQSTSCPHQAFRYDRHVHGFQFHLEVDERMIERWLALPDHAEDLLAPGGGTRAETIRAETARFIQRQKELSRLVFTRYIDEFSTKRRKILLGSGHR